MRGRYQVGDRVETFTRYDGVYRSTDDAGDTLVLDDRVEALMDGWVIRGGVVGAECLWVRGETEHRADAVGFTGLSPGFEVATARRLALAEGDSRHLVLVELTPPVGAALTVRRTWTRTEGPDEGIERYEVADVDTGEGWVLHLAGDVLVSREGRWPAHLLHLEPS